ncbi:MAG: DUF11 domain-containing protein, partial [Flavobacteriaceae bacterium]|nr:DUF11 domain-containing protein [Flavobacteriaceae bacterium]
MITPTSIPDGIQVGQTDTFSATVQGQVATSTTFTYEWISSCSGTFTTPNAASTEFTPDAVTEPTECIIRLVITDECGRQNFLAETYIVYPITDLSVTKTATADAVAGETVDYDITVSNVGTFTGYSATVEDALPAGTTYVSSTASAGTYTEPTWTIGDLLPGASETLSITATVNSDVADGSTITNTATVTSLSTDNNPANDSSDDSTNITALSDLVTVKTLSSGSATPDTGDAIEFTITVNNAGPSDALGVSLTDLLPAGLTLTGNTPSSGSYNLSTGLWDGFDVMAGTSETLVLSASVDVDQAGQTIQNITTTAVSTSPLNPDTTGDDLEETVTVTAATSTITANDDNFSADAINGTTGGNSPTVFTNDDADGTTPATNALIDDATIQITNDGGLAGVSINTDGEIVVPPLAPIGMYTVTYQICLTADNTICDTATVMLNVQTIDAVGDDFTATKVDGTTGGTTATVFTNDDADGTTPATDALIDDNISITNDGGLTGVSINTDGTIDMPAGTTQGVYTVTYQICLTTDNTICDTADATIDVQSIDAVDDDFSGGGVNGTAGGTTPTVFTNDNANGTSPATDALIDNNISISNDGGLAGVSINTDGNIVVPAGTAAGTFLVEYTICLTSVNTICDTAFTTVKVDPGVLVANVDDFSGVPVNGYDGGIAGDITTNDTLNGVAVIDTEITIALDPVSNTIGATVDANGNVSVPAGTAAGTYNIDYSICEILNPTNCSTNTVAIEVDPAPILAEDDIIVSPVNGYEGSINIANALDNDILNGVIVDPSEINLSAGSTGPLTLNPDGSIDIAPQTPAGSYSHTYAICETLNPSNCDLATIFVVVEAAPIDAVADDLSASPVNGYDGITGLANVLDNDTLNGDPVIPSEVSLAPVTDGPLTVNADGTVDVAPQTAA